MMNTAIGDETVVHMLLSFIEAYETRPTV